MQSNRFLRDSVGSRHCACSFRSRSRWIAGRISGGRFWVRSGCWVLRRGSITCDAAPHACGLAHMNCSQKRKAIQAADINEIVLVVVVTSFLVLYLCFAPCLVGSTLKCTIQWTPLPTHTQRPSPWLRNRQPVLVSFLSLVSSITPLPPPTLLLLLLLLPLLRAPLPTDMYTRTRSTPTRREPNPHPCAFTTRRRAAGSAPPACHLSGCNG